MQKLGHLTWILGVSPFCLFGVQGADLSYRAIDLGVLENLNQPAQSAAYGINDLDQITGFSVSIGTQARSHPFVWANGTMIDLGTNGWDNLGLHVVGRSINNLGHVAGDATTSQSAEDWRAFLWTPQGRLTDLGFPGDWVNAFSINDLDQIAFGGTDDVGDALIGFWDMGVFHTVEPLPPATSGLVLGINNSGQMVGYSGLAVATIWTDGVPRRVGGLGGNPSFGDDINDINEICGTSATEIPNEYGVFKWVAGQIIDLHSYGNQYVGATNSDLNNAGEVIAQSDFRSVMIRDGVEYDLQESLDAQSAGWEISGVYDINDAGRIVGAGRSPSGEGRAFMLIPNEFRVAGPIPGLAGRQNVLRAVGAEPNKRVYFIYGFASGRGEVPGCPGLFVDIAQPILAGFTDANAEGEALLVRNVPASAAGAKIIFQAVQRNSCEVARPVWHKFP